MRHIICDISTAPIDGVDAFVEEPEAPANYKDPIKIAAYILEAKAKACEKAALDPDLGRITGIGLSINGSSPIHFICKTERDEYGALSELAPMLEGVRLIGFNAMRFDWPVLVRRGQYLGIDLAIDMDRYRTDHVDLLERLTNHGQLTARSLGFYARRLGYTDLVKPLSGAEEACVPATGRWDELKASLEHDVIAIQRLANWMGVLKPEAVPA